jgi:hypothetical protein
MMQQSLISFSPNVNVNALYKSLSLIQSIYIIIFRKICQIEFQSTRDSPRKKKREELRIGRAAAGMQMRLKDAGNAEIPHWLLTTDNPDGFRNADASEKR